MKLFAALLLALPLYAQSGPDERAVRDVVQKYVSLRDHQDAAGLEKLFTADADQLVSSGEWRKGRAELVKGTLESSRKTGGKRTITVESVRFLGPGIAIADGRYELTNLAGGTNRKMWTSILVSRSPDGWHIAAIRNMLPGAPIPAK